MSTLRGGLVVSAATAGLLALVSAPRAAAQGWVEKQKLVAGDGQIGNSFGSHVTVHGGTAIVGDSKNDHNGRDAGAAYVFVFDGAQWVETQKLVASDAAGNARFGPAALSGDMAVIGAGGLGTGSAYVFAFDGVEWVETQKLAPSLGVGGFGGSVFMAGGRALVAAGGTTFVENTATFVFRLDGGEWVEEAVLAYIGRSFTGDVAITQKRDSLYCCTPEDIPLYRRDGETWILADRFRGGPQVRDLALGEDLIAVTEEGAQVLRMLLFDGTRWIEGPNLTPRLEPGEAASLAPITLGDDIIVVTHHESGGAFVFRFDGVQWYEEQRLVASDGKPDGYFGGSALEGDRLLIGAPGGPDGLGPGAAYVFEATGPSVELKIGGDGAVYPHDVVAVEGPLTLSLDMKAGTDVLDHYYFWWTDGTFYWITADGVSDTPAPVASLAPVDLTDFPLADTALPPGDWVFGWLMLDGSRLVDRDFIVAHVTP